MRDAEQELEHLGRTRAQAEAARAWAEVADLRSARADHHAAGLAWLEAARFGLPAAWSYAADELGLAFRFEEAEAALVEGAMHVPTLQADLDALRSDLPAAVDFGAQPGISWSLWSPFARWNPAGSLDVDAATGVGTVAGLSLRRTDGRLGLRLSGTVDAQDWGHRLNIRLGPATGSGGIDLFVQEAGGGGYLSHEVGLGPNPWILVPDDVPGQAHTFRISVAELRGGSTLLLDVEWDGEHAGTKVF